MTASTESTLRLIEAPHRENRRLRQQMCSRGGRLNIGQVSGKKNRAKAGRDARHYPDFRKPFHLFLKTDWCTPTHVRHRTDAGVFRGYDQREDQSVVIHKVKGL
jgi:hypothetical protein